MNRNTIGISLIEMLSNNFTQVMEINPLPGIAKSN